MEDVLDLYEQAPDPHCPRLVFDERPCQLLDDTREPLPLQVGSSRKVDDAYERCGTCTLFLAYDLESGQRYVQVRAHRTKADYAAFWDWLITTYYPTAAGLHVVQDNLNTHTYGAFYEHLPVRVPINSRTCSTFTLPPSMAVGSTSPKSNYLCSCVSLLTGVSLPNRRWKPKPGLGPLAVTPRAFAPNGALRPLSLAPNSSAIIPLSILIIKRSIY